MRKSYVLIYSEALGTREEIKECVNSIPEVITWRYDLPSCFYLISENSASELSNAIRAKLGKNGRFLITEVTSNKQGWLPKKSWYILNNKTNMPKE